MILFGLRDVGSVNACLPVIEKLKKEGFPISVYAEGASYECLKGKLSLIAQCPMDYLLDSVSPSLVVATCATTGETIPIDLTVKAKQRNLPVVLVEDMWAAHNVFEWERLPDGVCVMDEFAKSLIRQSWPNYTESCIHKTGSPIFDKFADMDVRTARHKLRDSLGLSKNWPIVFFPATYPVRGMIKIIQMLVEALNGLNIPVYLILRDHPSITFSSEASEYRKALKNLKTGQVVDSSKLNSNEVNAGSDIVVGTFSTMTVEACYLRKPVLIISTSEINRLLAESTNNALSQWPLINLGAALKAGSVDEIKNCLNQIIAGDMANMLEAQRKHFQTDGLSAVRIANVILKYYR